MDRPAVVRSRERNRAVIIPELSLEEVTPGSIEAAKVILSSRVVT